MRYTSLPPHVFAARRNRFLQKMKRNAVAIFFSHDAQKRNGDVHFTFRQDSDLFSMTGIDQPKTILVLITGPKKGVSESLLFILPEDARNTIWNGKRISKAEANRISGLTNCFSISQWDQVMKPILQQATTAYLLEDDHLPASEQSAELRYYTSHWRKSFPGLQIVSSRPWLDELRMKKFPEEIAMMRHAIDVTGHAFLHALKNARPGMHEYEIEALLTYEILRSGCHHAFEPIVASGVAACTLHYVRNDKKIRAGELVLLDFGAEYGNMASDMSRTFPASGKFSERQLHLYKEVLRVLDEITDLMRPGITLAQLNTETGKCIDAALIHLKLATRKEIRLQDKSNPVRRQFFMHGIGHHLGYDVHDPYQREAVLAPGMIITCEPGLYIKREKTGIRLENDILITKGKPINLMESIPIEPDEIESLMNG